MARRILISAATSIAATIGQRRNQLDVLEAILYPNSSLARGYESQALLLADGRTFSARRCSSRSNCQMPRRMHNAVPARTKNVASSHLRWNILRNSIFFFPSRNHQAI